MESLQAITHAKKLNKQKLQAKNKQMITTSQSRNHENPDAFENEPKFIYKSEHRDVIGTL